MKNTAEVKFIQYCAVFFKRINNKIGNFSILSCLQRILKTELTSSTPP